VEAPRPALPAAEVAVEILLAKDLFADIPARWNIKACIERDLFGEPEALPVSEVG